jgi:hypothetical protein
VSFYTGRCSALRVSRVGIESSILFSFELILPEGEGSASRSNRFQARLSGSRQP